jgi:hypothetical protein
MANGYALQGVNPQDCLPPFSTGSSRRGISTQISTQTSVLAGLKVVNSLLLGFSMANRPPLAESFQANSAGSVPVTRSTAKA